MTENLEKLRVKTGTNCIAGRKCSGCGSAAPFQIWSLAFVTWTDDGAGDASHFRFTDDSKARCVECGLYGTVKEVLPKANALTCNDPNCASERFTAQGEVATTFVLDGDGKPLFHRSPEREFEELICDVCGEEATLH